MRDSSNSSYTVFTNIAQLLTLQEAARRRARLIGRDESVLSIIPDAAMIANSQGELVWIGPESEWVQAFSQIKLKNKSERQTEIRQVVDLGRRVVMPAFVECHTHLVFAGNRQDEFEKRMLGASYAEIAQQGGGIKSTVRATRGASLDELLGLAEMRLNRFIQQGVTTLEVKSGYGLNWETESKLLQVAQKLKALDCCRVVPTYLGAHSLPLDTDPVNKPDEYVDSLIQDLQQIKDMRLAQRVDIFVEDGYFNLQLAKRFLQAAHDKAFDLVLHADQLSPLGGAGLAAEMGAKSADHLICISDSDIKKLANSQTTAVLLPAADLYLKCAFPPARRLLQAGACVAIATDFNPGSSPTQDLSLVGVLARLEMKMSLVEVLVAYTLGASYALGLENKVGSLEPGKDCDFIVLEDDWRDLFYSIGHHSVASVWRQARQLQLVT